MRLNDKVAVVTGGTSDIGRAIALRFAREGANLVIGYHNYSPKVSLIVKEIENLERKVITVKVDISQLSNAEQMIRDTVNVFGRIDILVNNAAASWARAPIFDITEQELDKVIGVNLKGYFQLHCNDSSRDDKTKTRQNNQHKCQSLLIQPFQAKPPM